MNFVNNIIQNLFFTIMLSNCNKFQLLLFKTFSKKYSFAQHKKCIKYNIFFLNQYSSITFRIFMMVFLKKKKRKKIV